MDLLDESNNNKKKKTGVQKLVLTLLIVSILLAIIIIVILMLMKNTDTQHKYTIAINGNIVPITDLGFIQTEDGKKYVSIKELCNKLGYKYYNGEFNVAEESKDRGYVNNGANIVQFFADSNEIYKTVEKSETDYEYYKLKNKIEQSNEALYINLEDISLALNVLHVYSEEMNQEIIVTPTYWIQQNTESLETLEYVVSDTPDNIKALSYGYVIIENNGRYGVISLEKEELIGNKYNSITFIEYTQEFIVSNSNNKYGIINTNGTTDIDLEYDSIKILNYNPLLFQVEKLDSLGIMKENGEILNEIRFTEIGFPADEASEIYYTLIIPELNENIPRSIVVAIDKKYGLLDLDTGKEIIPCELNGIFLIMDKDLTKYYVVRLEDDTVNTLENYIDLKNKITVNIH